MIEIKDSTFGQCTLLNSITIPDSVIKIGGAVFYGCDALESISLPDGIQEIGGGAFEFSGLKSIKFPKKLKVIETNVCYYCGELQSVIIPEGVTAIEDRAFYCCHELKSINIPNSVKTIGFAAFTSMGQGDPTAEIEDTVVITIGSGITKIGDEDTHSYYGETAFRLNRPAIIYCKSIIPPSIFSGEFGTSLGDGRDFVEDKIFYVPKEALEAYQNAPYWRDFAYVIVGYDF